MKFEIKHEFSASPEQVAQAMLDATYLPFVVEHHDTLLEAELLSKNESAGKIERRVRYRPKPVIESIGPKKVPKEWFAFVEESTWDPIAKRLTFKNVPTTEAIKKMMFNHGTVELREIAPGKTQRTTSGELKLDLPFFMKPLAAIGERIIYGEAVKLLDGEAEVLKKRLAAT